jgi:hypothetical protein
MRAKRCANPRRWLAAGGAGPDGYYSPGEQLLTVPGTCDRSTRRHVLDWLQSSVALPSALQRRSHGGCLPRQPGRNGDTVLHVCPLL